jgi:hypothetical protein
MDPPVSFLNLPSLNGPLLNEDDYDDVPLPINITIKKLSLKIWQDEEHRRVVNEKVLAVEVPKSMKIRWTYSKR